MIKRLSAESYRLFITEYGDESRDEGAEVDTI